MSSSKQSALLLDDSSLVRRVSSFFPTSIASLPKIPRIQHKTESTEPFDSTTITTNYPKIIITQDDALRIFQGLTILFVGDPFLRILYHDLVKLLSTGRLLEQSEAVMQHGEYRPNPSNISDLTVFH